MIACTEGGRRLRDFRNTSPLVSIVTVVFRAADELAALIASIAPHLGSEVEWIVIDGGSDDGTVSLL
jgi:glycosyltransferase involved in cell wall biosynthesis